MNIDINVRRNQLTDLQNYHKDVDMELTMILQNLQWDRQHLIEHKPMVACQYDDSHSVPPDKLLEHEKRCFLKSQGYTETDRFLPSPVDTDAATLVKLSTDDIRDVINSACRSQPLFRRGAGCSGPQPLTLERLQATYTPDERRAMHDAVVNQVPSSHSLSDLALVSSKDDVGKESKAKSRLEILAELRDMRRRRTKYRVAAKTRNYSDVLREVITTQMEVYTQGHNAASQILNSRDADNTSKASDDGLKDKNTSSYGSNASNGSNYNIKEKTSVSNKDMYSNPRHSRHHERYEIKGRHNDPRHGSTSSRSSKRQELDEPAPGKVGENKDDEHRDSTAKRRDFECSDSVTENRKRRRYDDLYESSHRHRDSRNLYSTKDKSRESSDDYRKSNDKHDSHARYHAHRDRQDHDSYRNKRIGHKNRNDVNRKERYECKGQQGRTARIKKEKRDSCGDDSNSSEDDATEYSDNISHRDKKYYSSTQRFKKEKGEYVKKEGKNSIEDVDYHGKSSAIRSDISCDEHNNSTGYKDKRKYYEKNNDSTRNQDRRQPERKVTVIQNIKRENVDA